MAIWEKTPDVCPIKTVSLKLYNTTHLNSGRPRWRDKLFIRKSSSYSEFNLLVILRAFKAFLGLDLITGPKKRGILVWCSYWYSDSFRCDFHFTSVFGAAGEGIWWVDWYRARYGCSPEILLIRLTWCFLSFRLGTATRMAEQTKETR